jgi:hypothetical protein
MATRIQVRRGSTSDWNTANPILTEGEFGYNTTLDKFKIGDGTSTWSVLEYVPTSADLSSSLGDYIALTEKGGADGVAELDATYNVLTKTAVVFEGTTDDSYEITLLATDPTADRTITLPNVTGTVITTGNLSDITNAGTFTGNIVIEGATADDYELTLSAGNPTADRTITFPDATGTVALTSDIAAGVVTETAIQTLTNKTLTSPVASGLYLSDSSIILEGSSADDHETTLTIINPTADRTITFPDETGTVQLRVTDVSDTEIGYLNGVTSAIQTQMDAKAPLASPTFTGTVSAATLTLSGDLTVNGTTTTINSTTISVDDKNIVLGDVATPTDTTADGGGITLKGATDKTLNWVDATDAWTSSEDFNLLTGKVYEINGTPVLSSTTLGSGVTTSSLTSVGTIATGVWNGTTIAIANGGTGATTAMTAAAALLPSQTSNSGKYLTTDGSGTLSWGTVSGYLAPTIGSTSIASGATVTTIAGLTLTAPNIGAATGTSLTATGGGVLARAASTQDGVEIRGRSGGTGNWEVILTPTTLSADQTLTLPNETGTLLTSAQFSAKGILLVGTGTGTFTTQSVGTNGQVLTANSAQADGVEWSTPAAGAAFSEFMLIGA